MGLNRDDPDGMTPAERAAYDAVSDEIVAMIYEDALADEEPWALEAYRYRSGES